MPGWNIVGINNTDLSTATIFAKDSVEETPEQVVILVASDGPNDAPGTRYEEAVASSDEAESLGIVEIDGFSTEAFRYRDEYHAFLWQNTETVIVQVHVLGLGYDEARAIVAAVTPITQETWVEYVAQFPQTEMTTTTMLPLAPNSDEATGSGEPTSLFPRVVIDLPGFEILGGSEGAVESESARWYGEWDIRIGDTTGRILLDSKQTAISSTFSSVDTTEQIAVADTQGLLGRHDSGFVIEWTDIDTRFTVHIDGTTIDPSALVEAIDYVDEMEWRELLSSG